MPGLMANRARRYEREFRRRQGIVADALILIGNGPAVVRSGPFAGMRYPPDRIADVDTPGAKLLGTYEREIRRPFAEALRRGVRTFVDIGCADGYYAVGMAFASQELTTFAYDLASSARRLCREVAQANGVASRVHVHGRFTGAVINELDLSGALVLCDIEGSEADLFSDSVLLKRLCGTTVVIEVHETNHPGLSDWLDDRFARSHAVEHVYQQRRSHGLEEFRPPELHWLICEPHVGVQ